MANFLMCRPSHFSVKYIINPWMKNNVNKINKTLAKEQWQHFYDALKKVANVVLLPAHENLPDLVFTANAGLVHNRNVILSHFQYVERQAEETINASWFSNNQYKIYRLPNALHFEGAGDALLQTERNTLWLGYGFRSDANVATYLSRLLTMKTVSLQLIDPYFYHLDTCLCPLLEGDIMYYPNAFSDEAQQAIQYNVAQKKQILVSEEDAKQFACNAVVVATPQHQHKGIIFINYAGDSLIHHLKMRNYSVVIQPVTEFNKAGGANKCLTLAI